MRAGSDGDWPLGNLLSVWPRGALPASPKAARQQLAPACETPFVLLLV